jgi:sulfofructose kinase
VAEIIGFGQIVVDVRCFVPRIPGLDEVVYMDDMDQQLGGMVGIAMVAAARLGGDVELVSLVGDDPNGAYCLRELNQIKVGCAGVKAVPGETTPFSAVLVDKTSGKRTIVFNRGLLLKGLKLEAPSFSGARFLHMDGTFFESACLAAQKAKQDGLGTVVDLSTNERNSQIDQLLRLTDYIVVPQRFAAYYTNENAPQNAGRKLMRQFNPEAVVITMGDQGSLFFANGLYQAIPAFPVTVKDTTGAGDSFHGGFVFALNRGYSPVKAVIFASAVAALKCSRTGGIKAFPVYDEVIGFLNQHSCHFQEPGC